MLVKYFSSSFPDCTSKGKLCDRGPAGYYPEFAWSLTSAEDSWAKDQTMAKTKASSQGWEEGKDIAFFTVNHAFPTICNVWQNLNAFHSSQKY